MIQRKTGDEPVGGVAVLAQAPLEVDEAEPEGEREADAVGVDLERPDVEVDGDRFHGSARCQVRTGRAQWARGSGTAGGAGECRSGGGTGYGRPAPTKSPPRRSPVIQTDAPV